MNYVRTYSINYPVVDKDSLVVGFHIVAFFNDTETAKPVNKELVMDTRVELGHLLNCTETGKLYQLNNALNHNINNSVFSL